MADWALDTQTHDLVISQNGDFEILDGIDAIAQHCKIRLQFFLGEWFLDTRIGFPYYEQVLRKAPDLNVVRALFRETILQTPGVEAVSTLNLEYEPTTRQLDVEFNAQTTEGALTFSEFFILPIGGA